MDGPWTHAVTVPLVLPVFLILCGFLRWLVDSVCHLVLSGAVEFLSTQLAFCYKKPDSCCSLT